MMPFVPPSMMDPERLSAAGLGSEAEMLARLLGTNAVFGGQQQAAQPAQAAPQQAPAQMAQMQPQGGGGGFLDGIRNFLDGGQGQKVNQTVQWLQHQGLDAGTSQALARNPALLQDFLKQKMDPLAPLQQEKLGLEIDQMRNPRMAPGEEARLGLDRQRFDFERSNAQMTSDIREYQQAKREGYEGDFRSWQIEMKQAGGMTINNNMAGEKAWDTESAKLWAKRYDDMTASAMNSQSMLGMYDLAEQALNSGVRTGFGAEAELTLRQMGAAMGLETDPEKMAGGELIRSVQNRMALLMRSPDGGMGMPGALSDRDIKFLKDSQIGIDRSPEGNRRMLEAYRLMEQRKIDLAALADQYVMENGRLDSGFNRYVKQWAEQNPLFPQAPLRSPQDLRSGGGLGAPSPGAVEDGFRFKGGDPGNPASWERVQ